MHKALTCSQNCYVLMNACVIKQKQLLVFYDNCENAVCSSTRQTIAHCNYLSPAQAAASLQCMDISGDKEPVGKDM